MVQKKMISFVLILMLGTAACLAQEENINTDRPDQSDGVYTVSKNKFQLENGITAAKETFMNNFMLRYGLSNFTEIRLLLDAGKEAGSGGLKPVTISAKQRILQQHTIIPAITLAGYISLGKLASKDFQDDNIPFELKLAFENELSDKFSIAYNAGVSNEFETLNLSMNFSFAPAEKVSTFIEYFSSIRKLEIEHNIDAGILYLIKSQLQFDIACGRSIASREDRFFTTLGLSYLFD